MLRRTLILVLSAFLLVAVQGCSRRARIIPEEDFINLMMEMFIADQWLREHGDARDQADTTLFFEPIFQKYGYSFKDYDASLYHYTGKINRFSEMVYEAVGKMEKLKLQYAELVKLQREVLRKNQELLVPYEEKIFYSDTSLISLPGSLWPDKPQLDTLPVVIVDIGRERQNPGSDDVLNLESKTFAVAMEKSAVKKLINQ